MSAGAFKRHARGRCAVPSWTRGYAGRYVTRRPWAEIAARLGYVAAPLLGVALGLMYGV